MRLKAEWFLWIVKMRFCFKSRRLFLPGLLVERLVRPLRVEPAELVGQRVVLPHEDGVYGGEDGLLAVPGVSGLEAEAGLGLALGVLRGEREQVLAAVELLGGVEAAALELAQLPHLAQVRAVHVGAVGEGGDLEKKEQMNDNLNVIFSSFFGSRQIIKSFKS